MSKVWRHPNGREFPATYHYAQDMSDYYSATVAGNQVDEDVMDELGYTLVEREDPPAQVVRMDLPAGSLHIGLMETLTVPSVALILSAEAMAKLDGLVRSGDADGTIEFLEDCGFGRGLK